MRKPVLFKDGDGHPLLLTPESVCKACWVDGYGPNVQTRIMLENGLDAFVTESVEEVYKILQGD